MTMSTKNSYPRNRKMVSHWYCFIQT